MREERGKFSHLSVEVKYPERKHAIDVATAAHETRTATKSNGQATLPIQMDSFRVLPPLGGAGKTRKVGHKLGNQRVATKRSKVLRVDCG